MKSVAFKTCALFVLQNHFFLNVTFFFIYIENVKKDDSKADLGAKRNFDLFYDNDDDDDIISLKFLLMFSIG